MKKLKQYGWVAILLTFICQGGAALCQGAGVLTSAPVPGVENTVRYDAVTGKYIACSNSGGATVHFLETDMSTFVDIEVLQDATIMDFEIIGRYVFFCGHDMGSGFLGWFNIDTLFQMGETGNLGGPVHVDRTLINLNLVSLDNIEVYLLNDTIYNVAGYGPGSGGVYLAFEAVGNPLSGMQYRTLLLDYDNFRYQITDMAVTDKFVVYVCADRGGVISTDWGYGIMLYPFPKYDMFAMPYYPGYFFQTVVVSIYNDSLYTESNEPFTGSVPLMVHVDGDMVTVAAHRRDNDFLWCYTNSTLPVSFLDCQKKFVSTSLVFRTYDLSPLISTMPIGMVSAYAVSLYNNPALFTSSSGTPSMIDMTYDPLSKSYRVLHNHETSAGVYEYAVTDFNMSTISATSEYQTAFTAPGVWWPYSMCVDNGSQYTVGGFNVSGLQEYIFWQRQVGGEEVPCSTIVPNPVDGLPTMPEKELNNHNPPIGWLPLVYEVIYPENIEAEECIIMCN